MLFIVSLAIVIMASAHFTRKLETLCEIFKFSVGILSLLSALGANIPNYVSSTIAMLDGHLDLGIGIILGSNLYNITIILGLCTFVTPAGNGIYLGMQAKRHVGVIAWYTFAITLGTWGMSALLPGSPFVGILASILPIRLFFLCMAVLILAIFGGFFVRILRHSHEHPDTSVMDHTQVHHKTPFAVMRLSSEILLMLVIALGGVMVMVQSGQTLTSDLHMPSVLAGLLVLAVATSLPNTIVALSLVRTGEVAACVEEIYSSASINTVLGIALPLVIWPSVLQDRFLLFLDSPLLLALTLGVLFCIMRRHFSRGLGFMLLSVYIMWVIVRFWI